VSVVSKIARLATFDAVMDWGITSSIFPAAVLLVLQDGRPLHQRAYGFLDPERCKRPAQLDSLFDLASLTKLFTTLAFMALVDAGQVTVDTPVVTILPEFGGSRTINFSQDPLTKKLLPPDPAFAGQQVDAGQVTFRHLLTHTSGLAAWRSLFEVEADEDTIPLPADVPAQVRARRVAAIWKDYGFVAPPGAQLIYSDLGFIVLGEAVARLNSCPLDIAIDTAVIEPLRMRRTMYNPLQHGCRPTQIAPTGMCRWRQRPCVGEVNDENAAGLGGVSGHAGLFATAHEVATLGQMMLDQGRFREIQVLSPAAVAAMTAEQVSQGSQRRGLGWMLQGPESPVGAAPGPNSFGHTGFTGTSLWVDPDLGLVTVLLTNRVYNSWDQQAISSFRPALHSTVMELAQGL
jgi:CubicO group peptidase (beta-lactamase class C family)